MNKTIYKALTEYKKSKLLRMHMPGHKGRKKLSGIDSSLDITEITGFDNRHNADGIIKKSMEIASKKWGSEKSYYLVNGSTCGLLSAVRALTKRGDKVIVARNAHKSVFNAIELCGLHPVFIMPSVIEEWNIFGSVTENSVKKALEENDGVKLVIITSPTYEGVISDIASISKLVHKHNALLLVDEAHGAHLGFKPFTDGAVKNGADVVIESLHKTLDAPTQTAIMHCGKNIDFKKIERQLSVFETSSPSYAFLSSIDRCVRELNGNSFVNWAKAIDEFYEKSQAFSNIKVLGNCFKNYSEIFDYDKTKIVIYPENELKDGYTLFEVLRKECNIECEMATGGFVLALTGAGDDKKTIRKLYKALLKIDSSNNYKNRTQSVFLYENPIIKTTPEKASEGESEIVNLTESHGRVSAEYVWAYPPGIPIVIPGEEIPDILINIDEATLCHLKSEEGILPFIKVLK